MTRGVVAAALLLCAGCGPDKPDEQEAPAADLRIGQLMVETGHRFETSGRAAVAERWGLARYQAHEIIELFEADMPRALLPGECDDALADGFYFGLMETHLPAVVAAAEREDANAYRARYATAAQQCNGCHTTCAVPFVEVPTTPGLEVPALAPRGASRAGGAPTEVLDPWAAERGDGEAPSGTPSEAPADRGSSEIVNPW